MLRKVSLLGIAVCLCALPASGQRRKARFPVWTFHAENVNIYGLSLGLASLPEEPKNNSTNGIKLEFAGAGLLVILIPDRVAANEEEFKREKQKPISERVNGLNLALTGTFCDCQLNGLALGTFGHYLYRANGITAAIFLNSAQIIRGIQAALLFNNAYDLDGLQLSVAGNGTRRLRGLQVGLFNDSGDTRGVQIGLWNVNERRRLPLINWNFHRKR